MPRSLKSLQIFLASPSDVFPERNAINEVVHDLNKDLSAKLNVQLEILRWESDAYPAFGKDPQLVVNQQIGDAYDIFIGIFWQRIGSPTPRADSGTVEEFQRALSRFERDPSSIQIMLYFKDAAVHPNNVDIEQLHKVQQFRAQVSKIGLICAFETTDQFAKEVRKHLTRVLINSLSEQPWPASPTEPTKNESGVAKRAFDEFLDFSSESLTQAQEIAARLSGYMQELGQAVTASVPEFKPPNTQKASNKLANQLRSVADRMAGDVRLLRETASRGIKVIQKSTNYFPGISKVPEHSLHNMKDALKLAARTLRKSALSMTEMSSAIGSIPDVTLKLKRAKREVRAVIEALESEFAAESRLCETASDMYSDLLDRSRHTASDRQQI